MFVKTSQNQTFHDSLTLKRRDFAPLLLSSVSYPGPWQSSLSQLGNYNLEVKDGTKISFKSTYHHDPDKKEGVADQNEKNWNFTNIEVNSICFKERTILNYIIVAAWMISINPQSNPYCNVDYWASCEIEVLDETANQTNNGLTTAKYDEVFELY